MYRIIIYTLISVLFSVISYAADPVISSFTATKSGTTVNFSWSVTDTDSDLTNIKIYRARDDIGAPRTWDTALAYTETISGASASGTGSDTPGDGIWWYGLKVTDDAGNFADYSFYPDSKQINLETNTCTDSDGDGWYLEPVGCSNRFGFKGHNDCEDTYVFANPDREELCGNGIDDDCDGETDEVSCTTRTIYYVKNSGNDSLDGLSDGNAWKTLSKVETSAGTDSIILLNRGDIWKEEFTIPANGMEINAYGTGNKPIISGAETVTSSWNIHPTLSNVYQASYTGDVDNLLHDNSWLHIAHEPDGLNDAFTRDDPATSRYEVEELGDDMLYTEAQITSGRGALVGMVYEWRRHIFDITSYVNGTISLDSTSYGSQGWTFFKNGITPDPDKYWLIDTITYLDTVGEWFSDTSNLYVYSTNSPTGTWEVMTREFGIKADTKDDLTIMNVDIQKSVNGIWLEDCLRFKLDNVNVSYIGTQRYRSGAYANNSVSQGITIKGDGGRVGEEGLIQYCNINHVLAKGITILDYHDVDIFHNILEEISTCGVTEAFEPYSGFLFAIEVQDFSGTGTRSTNINVENNYFKEVGGGFFHGMKQGTFTHNTGIHALEHLSDIGAFYCSGTESTGIVIDDNYLILSEEDTGIYLDSTSSNVTTTNNVIIDSYRCIHNHGGNNNVYTGNKCINFTDWALFVNYSTGNGVHIEDLDVQNNVFSTDETTFDHLYLRVNDGDYASDVPREDWFKELKNNQYYPDYSAAFFEYLNNGTYYQRSFSEWVTASSLESGSSIAKYSLFPTGTVSPTNYTAATPVTSTTIQAAIDSVTMAGDTVTIPCGTYSTDITATMYVDEDQDCTEANPCILQAETNGCVTFTGDLPSPVFRIGDYVDDSTSGADHWIFKGFIFEDVSEAEGSDNKTIGVRINGVDVRCTELKFTGFAKDEDSVYSYPLDYCIYPNENCTDGEIDHCYINVPQDKAMISLHQFYNGSIHDNYFSGTQDAQCNAFQMGESYATEHDYNAIVEDNFFQSDAHIKASSITIKNNTFTGRGSVTIRAGKDNVIDRNYFLDINGSSTNTQCGVRIHDSENTFSNNYMDGVTCGYAVLIPGRNSNDYDVADNTTIIGNTILDFDDHAIFLGYAYGDGSIPAEYPDNVDFINNIIIADGSEKEIIQFVGATNVSFTTCQHYAVNGASYWDGGTEITSGIIKADPNFTTETSNSYTLNVLQSSNNGTYDTDSLYDVFDATRNNPPDLGAIEYGGNRTSSPLLAGDVGNSLGESFLNFSLFNGIFE